MSREYPCIHYDNMRCKKFSVDGAKSWCLLGPCGDQVLSNGDRIRSLNDEELACILFDISYDGEPVHWTDAAEWLKKPDSGWVDKALRGYQE